MAALSPRLCLASACIVLILTAGCSDDPDPTGPEPSECAAVLEQARQSLESTLYAQLNSDPQQPGDVDFSGTYALYQRAHQCDPGCHHARLGLAITGLLALAADNEINAAFEEWRDYLESNTPFEVAAGYGRPLGIPLALSGDREALFLPFDLIATTLVARQQFTLQGSHPRISRVQDIFRSIVVPRLREASDLMEPVGNNPSYVFHVTALMQGDTGASTKILDRTDVLAMRAACTLLETLCRLACAYELSFATYDQAGLLSALNRDTGSFLRLRQDGAQHMNAVPGLAMTAIDLVDATITSLLAETGNQDDHIIKLDPRRLPESDVRELQDEILPEMRIALQGDYTLTEDWDLDPSTPDAALVFNLSNYFSNPVADWKQVMPPYTVSTEERVWEHRYHYDWEYRTAMVDVPSEESLSASVSRSVLNFDQVSTYAWGSPILTTPILDAMDDIHVRIGGLPDWGGNLYMSAYESRNFGAGRQQFTFSVYLDYSTATTMVHVPVLTWDAGNFADWRDGWMNPSLNGLLPEITSIQQLFDILGFDEDAWDQTLVIDWTELRGW